MAQNLVTRPMKWPQSYSNEAVLQSQVPYVERMIANMCNLNEHQFHKLVPLAEVNLVATPLRLSHRCNSRIILSPEWIWVSSCFLEPKSYWRLLYDSCP